MISRDGVSDVQEAVGAFDARDWRSSGLSGLEEGWVVDVGGSVIPRVELAGRGIKVLPHLTAVKDVFVSTLEHLSVHN